MNSFMMQSGTGSGACKPSNFRTTTIVVSLNYRYMQYILPHKNYGPFDCFKSLELEYNQVGMSPELDNFPG